MPKTTAKPRKANEMTTCSTIRHATTSPLASSYMMLSEMSEKTSSMNAALSVVCPANVLSIFASSSSRIEIPTDVGAKAQPAAKPSGKYRPVNAPTTTVPDASGSAVPAIATASARGPTTFIFSKWMCIPDAMIISVTPTLPMNVQIDSMCFPPFHVAPVQPCADEPCAEPAPSSSIRRPTVSARLCSESHAPSLAYGTTSSTSGPSTTPISSPPRMPGSPAIRKSRATNHVAKKKSTTSRKTS